MDKAVIVKNLLQGTKLDTLKLGAMIVADFSLTDFELIDSLEARLKALGGSEGVGIVKSLRAHMTRAGTVFQIARPVPHALETTIEKAPLVPGPIATNENAFVN